MNPANGHTQKDRAPATGPPPAVPALGVLQVPAERVKELVAALEVPFEASQIEWRVMNTTKNQLPARGQVVPYADQRAYTDRLNALFTPAGWTRKYTVHTSANFERSKDQKIAAKVLVTCELTIFAWACILPREKNGPTMITPAQVRKLRPLNEPALVLV
jgi:Rad52/22 family double-strand break repair protein